MKWLGTTAAVVCSLNAVAKYPERPIQYIVPFAAGGPADIVARTISEKLSDAIGQPVVVENKPGAGGIVGVSHGKKAKPDGYTLIQGTVSTHAINKSYYPDLPYDPQQDFEPLILVTSLPSALLVSNQVPVDTVEEFVQFLEDNPDEISFATPGDGTSTHLLGLLFSKQLNMNIPAIPYRGSTPAVQDVGAGHVTFMFDPLAASKGLVASGDIKILGMASADRTNIAPNIPTLAEAGIKDVDLQSWQAIFMPKNTPKEIISQLNKEINKILNNDEIQNNFSKLGMEVKGGSPEALADLINSEIPRWKELVEHAAEISD